MQFDQIRKFVVLAVITPALAMVVACEEHYEDPLMPAGTSRLPHEQAAPEPAAPQPEAQQLNEGETDLQRLEPASGAINLATPDSNQPISEVATPPAPTVSGYHVEMDETSRILMEQAQQQHQQRTTEGVQRRENEGYSDEVPAPRTPNPNVPQMPAEGPEMPAQ